MVLLGIKFYPLFSHVSWGSDAMVSFFYLIRMPTAGMFFLHHMFSTIKVEFILNITLSSFNGEDMRYCISDKLGL